MNYAQPIACLILTCAMAAASAQIPEIVRQTGTATPTGLAASEFGAAVALLGDIDGDLHADFAVGEPGDDTNGIDSGAVAVYSGATGSIVRIHRGVLTGDDFGRSLANVGDYDGDGIDDLGIGAPGANGVGAAFVFSGANGQMLLVANGSLAGDDFGAAICAAGDIDGDGRADFGVGAPGHDSMAAADVGRVEIYSGMTNAVIAFFDGTDSGSEFGSSLAGIGDADNDMRDDLAVGSPAGGVLVPGAGMVTVFSGATGLVLHTSEGSVVGDRFGASVAFLGDNDGDGRKDYLVGVPAATVSSLVAAGRVAIVSGQTGATIRNFDGLVAGENFGESVCSAGDVDGDGTADVAAAAPASSSIATDGGAMRVYSGADYRLLDVQGGTDNGGRLGSGLAGGLDLNLDGLDDIISGAPGADFGAVGAGLVTARAVIGQEVYGSASGGAANLQMAWFAGLDGQRHNGVLAVGGGAPIALGVVGLSIARDNQSMNGVNVLIDTAPGGLVYSSLFVFNVFGQAFFRAELRQPSIAGIVLHFQVFESAPVLPNGVKASNGVSLRFGS